MLTMPLNWGITSDSVGGPRRHDDQAKEPQVSAQIIKRGSYPTQRQCGALIFNVGKTEGQQAPEAGRSASPGPPGLRFQHLDKVPNLLTSWK